MTGLWMLAFVIVGVAASPPGIEARFRRDSSSSSSSYSGSSSGSGGVGGGYSVPSGSGGVGYSGPSGSGGGFSGFPSNGGAGFGYNNGGFAFPNPAMFFDFNSLFQQYLASLAAAQAMAAASPQYNTVFQQQLASLAMQQHEAKARFPYAFPDSNAIGPDAFGPSGPAGQPGPGGPAFASASANLGPQGGYGQASVAPGGSDGLGLRTLDEFPPPSGGNFGTFSSSSSGSSDVNGKRTSFKTATFGTNDNGKINFRTVSE